MCRFHNKNKVLERIRISCILIQKYDTLGSIERQTMAIDPILKQGDTVTDPMRGNKEATVLNPKVAYVPEIGGWLIKLTDGHETWTTTEDSIVKKD